VQVRRLLIGTVILAGSAVALWRVLSLGIADHYARSDPARALQWRSDHPLALTLRAEQLIEEGDLPAARDTAQRALRADPLQWRAYRVLAELAERSGEPGRAYALYRIAARHQPRDAATRVWLFNHHIAAGQAALAVSDLDALLRARPQLIPALSGIITGVATRPETQAAFVDALVRQPPWRATVVPMLVRQASDLDGLARLIEALRRSPVGLDASTHGDWVERLIRERRYDQAYLHWVGALPDDRRKVIGNVYNGDFGHRPTDAGFDWRIESVAGAHQDILDSGTGAALRLSFDDQRVPFRHLSQLLLLPPGHYRLAGKARAEALRSSVGLAWTLSCAEDDNIIATSEPLRGEHDWRSFTVDFSVPEARCVAQWLRLVSAARLASEQRISGSLWVDELSVTRQAAQP